MKLLFSIKDKFKAALLLGCMMGVLGVTTITQQFKLQNLEASYSSLYYDRLVPATDIFYLTENMFHKQLLLEKLLYAGDKNQIASVMADLRVYNDSTEALVAKFEKTFLVDKEKTYLKDFKLRVQRYIIVENKILAAYQSGQTKDALRFYENEGKAELEKTTEFLVELTKIQSTVGRDLMNSSHGIISSNDNLLTIQITIAIIIGLVVQGLILTSKMVNKKDPRFHLN
jgi:hypothetical protein